MNTNLIVGAVLLDISVIVLAICYIAERMPRKPVWTEEIYMSFIMPLIVGCLAFSVMFIGEAFFFKLSALTFLEIAVSLAILAAGVVILFLMRIKKRVAAYAALTDNPQSSQKREASPGFSTDLPSGKPA
jgi:hypothetical protein